MMLPLRRVAFSLLMLLIPTPSLFAPVHHSICFDWRPALEHEVAKAISLAEGYNVTGSIAQRQNNPGSFIFAHQHGARPGSGGYAFFATAEDGWRELNARIHQRSNLPIREMLRRHNPEHPQYPELVLRGTALDGDLVIAKQTTCGGNR